MLIRTRLLITFGLMLLMVVLVSGVALAALNQQDMAFQEYVAGATARERLVNEITKAVGERAIAARNLVLASSPSEVESEKAAVLTAHEKVTAGMLRMKVLSNASDPAARRSAGLIGEFEAIEKNYSSVAMMIVDMALKGRHEQAIEKMNRECRPLLNRLTKVADEYAAMAASESNAMVMARKVEFNRQRISLVIGCAIAAALAIAFGLLMTRSIVDPMNRAFDLAESVATGDLTVSIPSGGHDEVGRLLSALDQMSKNLAAMVQEVRISTQSIDTGSIEIAVGSVDLSRRTDQQASRLAEANVSMDELSGTVKQTANAALQATVAANLASEAAANGGRAISQVVASMNEIATSSHKISEIVGSIDSIAFQTNILALNAAVEAARADEKGRGFAVVASEVRILAQRSAEAAREIKRLISASVEKVEVGARQVSEAGGTMDEIVQRVLVVNQMISGISHAAGEQSRRIEQIGQVAAELDQVTQQNSALVKQSAASAENLNHHARRLTVLVDMFRLSKH